MILHVTAYTAGGARLYKLSPLSEQGEASIWSHCTGNRLASVPEARWPAIVLLLKIHGIDKIVESPG